jgi:hypothetical protein
VNAEFNWWLLIVGLVVGAGLVWFVLLDSRRRDVDVDEAERPREAAWLASNLADEGHEVSPAAADRMLLLHRAYLEGPPPDDPASDLSNDPSTDGEVAGAPSEVADDDGFRAERPAIDRHE